MWMLLNVFIFLTVAHGVAAKNNASSDSGFLSQCSLDILDLTITGQITDALRLFIVTEQFGVFHKYNISRAASIIRDPSFRSDFRSVIFVHGFSDSVSGSQTTADLVPAYMRRGGYNIMLLDAGKIIRIEYLRSARAARYIGRRLGVVLAQMYKSGFNLPTLELVGHSLGAHIVGFAGKTFRKVTGKNVPRIIGLDPGRPCFGQAEAAERLDKSDADFVQVIHTNAGGLGMLTAIGDIDFYVNGGKFQPADFLLPCLNGCSHKKAIKYWAASIEYPTGFIGMKCVNLEEIDQNACYGPMRKMAIMGAFATPRATGIFYVKTTRAYPFIMTMEVPQYYGYNHRFC